MNPTTAEIHNCQTCQTPNSKQRCPRCKITYYCNAVCQKRDWPLHKTRCSFLQNHAPSTAPESIQCVKIHSNSMRYAPTSVMSTDPIFTKCALPITLKFQFPLVMSKMIDDLPRNPSTDNQHATWLNIDPVSGFAPPQWQGGIGDVIVARADGLDLSVQMLAGVTDFVSRMLDRWEDGPPTDMFSKSKLEAFTKKSMDGQDTYERQLAEYERTGDESAFA